MNARAELTLRLIRTGQEALGPLTSPIAWTFFPEMQRMSWSEAAEVLASAPKPVLASALVEPGAIALWTMAALGHEGRAALEHSIQSQMEYYEAKLRVLGLDTSDLIETPDGAFRLGVAEFKAWVAEYCITVVGVGMGVSPTPGVGRLLVRPPGGQQAPVGRIV